VVQEVGLRFDDGISTVLHDPLMSAISMANYVASRLIADPMGNYPGTRQWLDRLGMATMAENRSDACIRAVALAALSLRSSMARNTLEYSQRAADKPCRYSLTMT
jgi:hypothetical protein